MPRQNQGKGRGQHPLGEQRGPAGVGSLEPTGQAEPQEVARGQGQKLLGGHWVRGPGRGGICLWKQGGPISLPNTSKGPLPAWFYGREGLLTPGTEFGQVGGWWW